MYTSYAPSRRTSEQSHPHEMLQKSRLHDPFFGLKSGFDQRPTSVATEIVDTDWDEEDLISEIEDDDPDSPRISLNSSGQPSLTTLSSYEEALTPRSSRTREAFSFDNDPVKPIKGPRGPHLFRSSMSSSQSLHHQETLTLSPITPKAPNPLDAGFLFPITHEPLPRSRTTPYQFTHERLDTNDLSLWSPEKVAQWMLNAGVEVSIAEKFVENDINGAILITLKFEDLKELSIPSFGVRTKIWEEIHKLRDSKPISPRPETPIEDEESREVRRERRRMEKAQQEAEPDNCEDSGLKRQKSRKRSGSKRQPSHEDIISPMESVSIVGIEQMMPKPHHCSKGENCSKFRRQQRMIEAFKKDHPFVDMDKGGMIMVAGDPGNPSTAQSLNHPPSTEALRPFSEAVPSVVASSDVLGPGIPPLQYLQEAALANLQSRDPQDNVRQFLDFQHQQTGTAAGEVPPTPPFEIYSGSMSPHEGLRALPKLSIPGQQPPTPRMSQQQHMPPSRPSTVQPTQQQTQQQWVPRAMDKADPLSPDLATPTAPYRFGTPFSDMDVPLTAVPLGPVSRDASQSVPPDMNYRAGPANGGPRSQSRTSRRPSFAVMAPLAENVNTPVAMQPSGNSISPPRRTTASPQSQAKAATRPLNPTQAPPRAQYPWSSSAQNKPTAPTAVPAPADRPMPNKAAALLTGGATQDAEGIQYQGPVRKRKTKMLRHEWHDQYATLKGTRLALHKDATTRDRTLEYVDIDDYAIACSSLSSGSKLNAAFKAMSISRSDPKKRRSVDDKDDVAAFSFQLIPQDKEGRILGGRLRKRESTSISGPMPLAAGSNATASSSSSLSSEAAALQGAVNGTGKTHHFAVKSRDQRIDWMRELMLAKALKQKGEGFEVSVNGNMI